MRSYALLLAGLAAAFSLRVLGQLVVVLFRPEFLPPNEEWYSGLIPYPFLLPIQIAILGAQCAISRDLWRGKGRFAYLFAYGRYHARGQPKEQSC